MVIETVGQLKELLSQHKDEVKLAIEDADEGSFLRVTNLSIEGGLLLIGGNYNNRITTIGERLQGKSFSEIAEARAI